MISIKYTNPNPRYKPYQVYQQQPVKSYYQPPAVVQTQLSIAAIRAAKVGITTDEWQRRDAIVRALSEECKWAFMDQFYPFNLEYYRKYGKCVFVNKAKTYQDLDHDDWPANDTPLIFTARALAPIDTEDRAPFICNLGFMQKDIPTE